jgi:hypothetical protein
VAATAVNWTGCPLFLAVLCCACQAEVGEQDVAMDAGEDGATAPGLRCDGRLCPEPGLGTACCTAPGTGSPGEILQNTGRAPDRCGADLGDLAPGIAGVCIELQQPGEADPGCPPQQPIGGGITMRGCCTAEGFCGSLETLAPFGCFYATGSKGRRCGDDDPDPAADRDAGH